MTFTDETLIEIARTHGSAYVYDLDWVRNHATTLQDAFAGFDLYYSVKANPLPRLMQVLTTAGFGLEIASEGEQQAARTVSSVQRLFIAGPVTSRNAADDVDIPAECTVFADSESELIKLAASKKRWRVGVRINLRDAVADAGEYMTGGSSRFGIDEEQIDSSFARRHPYVRAIQVYSGSQILDIDQLSLQFERICRFVDHCDLSELELVDFGGGIGVNHADPDRPVDINTLGLRYRSLLEQYRIPSQVTRALEFGRLAVAGCGVFLSTVLDVKHSRGRVFTLLDSGMNGFFRYAFMGDAHRVRNLTNRANLGGEVDVELGGRLCTPLDAIARCRMPIPVVGDVVALYDAGAYGFSLAPLQFLSFPWPAEVVVDGENVRLVRERVRPDEYSRLGTTDA